MNNIRSTIVSLSGKILRSQITLLLIVLILSGCSQNDEKDGSNSLNFTNEITVSDKSEEDYKEDAMDQEASSGTVLPTETPHSYLAPTGVVLETRINTPRGYIRIPSEPGELTHFLRNMKLKEDKSPVLLYDGLAKRNQKDHFAVFDMEIGDRDLQQCADSIMRIFAEYYWSGGEYNKIAFHLTNGFLMEYTKWRDGNRLVVKGNDVSWKKTKDYDDSYNAFRQYLDMVFAYAGTLSLTEECESITIDDIRPGDLFLQGGSPGHCVLVVDIAVDEDGRRCFLLAQGYMPAQDFHVLINPLHEDDPWYYEYELTFPLETPSWTFKEGSLARWGEFPLKAEDNLTVSSNTHEGPQGITHKPIKKANTNNKFFTTGDSAVSALSNQVQITTAHDVNQVTLLAVGDNLIHKEVIKSGKRIDGSYNFDHLYANLADDIAAADIAIINQETILGGDDFAYSGYPNFNSPTDIGEAVINAGFDVILHATNHTMDMGLKGVTNTFAFWSRYPMIKVLGINESATARDTIPILEKNGIRIAMLNYTYGLNGYQLPVDMPYLVNLLDKKEMKEDITKAKELADFVIVFPHWGTEYVYEATSMQKELTKFFYELGVDLVIGTHPHVLEPVTWIETEPDHRMLVYYSLGNFISYQKEAPRMLGGMAEITITKDASGTYISEAGITPIVTHYEYGPLDHNYGLFKLIDYSPEQALIHGVSRIAVQGAFTYEDTYQLAKQVLGNWFVD